MGQIDRLLERYRAGELNWDCFYRQAYPRILHMLRNPLRVPATERREVAADFYPRFVRLTRDYCKRGSNFDAYLYTALRFFLRTRGRRLQQKGQQEEVLIGCTDPDELCVHEPCPDIQSEPTDQVHHLLNVGSRGRDALRRQLIMCLCKNLPLLSDEEAERYACRLDLPPSWLCAVRTYIHAHMRKTSAERTRFREHRDRHFMAVRMLEEQIRVRPDAPPASPVERRKALSRIAFHRRRWRYYAERISRQNIHLSNREVALLLGLPKGSVDSGLNSLGIRLARLSALQLPSGNDYPAPGYQQPAQAV